ncbi:hypothetical protein S100390_v1c10050 [Spiroplasma sp. NBRC 100390]|uniref:hypothetical protein n=1 Tax=unclassified Spiroplasma TaxID=2637901 RepID=UPI0008928FCA|nr:MULTISPECIES: hypothetical protein [unclassified Spiroplasma]AOX44341.1 hypothetical protein STU14_v1c10050 [Spiroplasma sp. TU-14]APE13811.1 hypothetical protein S100390_v1c10050 [Spiroplasma sp. NBRC 100390]
MTDLISLKYFIVLNVLFFFFASSWEGIYLVKHFKNKRDSDKYIVGRLFYFLLVIISVGLVCNVIQLFCLFLTSNFTFTTNYFPNWSLFSRQIFYVITTAFSIFTFLFFFVMTYFFQWKTVVYFNKQEIKSIFNEYDLMDGNIQIVNFNQVSLLQFAEKCFIYKTNSKFYQQITTFFKCDFKEINDKEQISIIKILRLKHYSAAKINFLLTKNSNLQQIWGWLYFEQLITIVLIVFKVTKILLICYIFLLGVFQWDSKAWLFYYYDGEQYLLSKSNIIYVLSIVVIILFVLELLCQNLLCGINLLNKNYDEIIINLLKFVILIVALALFSYFFSSLNAYVQYLNLKNDNPTIKPSLIVERLLFWLQKDYLRGMGFFLLFPLIFSSFDFIFNCYDLIRNSLAFKTGKGIKREYSLKQLCKMKWDA